MEGSDRALCTTRTCCHGYNINYTKLTQNNSNTQTGDSSRYRGGRCSVSNTNVLTVLQIYFSVSSKPMFPIPKFLFLWRTVKQISLSSLIQCYLEVLDCTDY